MTTSKQALIAGAAIAFGGLMIAPAFADAVSDAKAAVAKYAGPQTTWEGPTKAPKPDKGKKIVFLSGDEQNDISHLYGVYIKEAGQKLGWDVTVIDGKGSPTSWLAGLNQAIALKPDGIAMFADAASLQDPIKAGVAQAIKFVGLHAAGLPGPAARPQSVRQHPGGPARDRQGRGGLGDRQFRRQGARRHPQP